MNETYLWYGKRDSRKKFKSNQLAQDSNAFSGKLVKPGTGMGGMGMGMGGPGMGGGGRATPAQGFGGRAKSKATSAYNHSKRDLVDASRSNPNVLDSVKNEHLPDAMQKMTAEQRKSHLQAMAAKRDEIRKKILEVSAQRDAHIAQEKQKRLAESGAPVEADASLSDAVGEAIDSQIGK